MTCRAALLVVILLLSCNFAWADQKILFREDFRDLRNWEPLYFPKIERHTTYTTVSEGGRTYLKAQSQASASAIVFKKTFNPYTTPRIRWRWKVDNVYQKWSGKEKSGDDYRKAFGKDPPKTASIAIMNDSDNTGEAAVSYVEFIEVSD